VTLTLASAGDPPTRALTSQYQSSIQITRDQLEATFGRVDILVNCAAINKREPILGLSHVSVHGATKGAVKQLTKVIAVERASRNIMAKCVIPSFMRTPLSAPTWADEKKRRWR